MEILRKEKSYAFLKDGEEFQATGQEIEEAFASKELLEKMVWALLDLEALKEDPEKFKDLGFISKDHFFRLLRHQLADGPWDKGKAFGLIAKARK
jgi:hypothetical protein